MAASGKGAIPDLFHAECTCNAVPEQRRSVVPVTRSSYQHERFSSQVRYSRHVAAAYLPRASQLFLVWRHRLVADIAGTLSQRCSLARRGCGLAGFAVPWTAPPSHRRVAEEQEASGCTGLDLYIACGRVWCRLHFLGTTSRLRMAGGHRFTLSHRRFGGGDRIIDRVVAALPHGACDWTDDLRCWDSVCG